MLVVYNVDKQWLLGKANFPWTCGENRGLAMGSIREISRRTAQRYVERGKAVTFEQAMAAMHAAPQPSGFQATNDKD